MTSSGWLVLFRAVSLAVACGASVVVVAGGATVREGGFAPAAGPPGLPAGEPYSPERVLETVRQITADAAARWIADGLDERLARKLEADAAVVLRSVLLSEFKPYHVWMMERGGTLGQVAEANAEHLRSRSYRDDDSVFWSDTDLETKIGRLWSVPEKRRAKWTRVVPAAVGAGYGSTDEEMETNGAEPRQYALTIYDFPDRVEISNACMGGTRPVAWIGLAGRFAIDHQLLSDPDRAALAGRSETDTIEVRFFFTYDEARGYWLPVYAAVSTLRATPRVLF